MNLDIIDNLFKDIERITGVKDIGYHEIKDGKLNAVTKTSTDALGIEKWKKVHAENPVYIKGTTILEEVMASRCPAVIQDVNNDSRAAGAFFLFGVDSIIILPVLELQGIKGIICTVSIAKLHFFTEDEVKRCNKLVMEINDKLLDK